MSLSQVSGCFTCSLNQRVCLLMLHLCCFLVINWLRELRRRDDGLIVPQIAFIRSISFTGNLLRDLREMDGAIQTTLDATELFQSLNRLENLNLSTNQLTDCPNFLRLCSNLMFCSLSSNCLSALLPRSSLWSLSKMTHLNLGSNELSSLPDDIKCVGSSLIFRNDSHFI